MGVQYMYMYYICICVVKCVFSVKCVKCATSINQIKLLPVFP